VRILELHLGDLDLELHPLLTMLRGIDHGRRREVADILAAIARGAMPANVTGLGEAHGILFGLTPGAVAALGLPSDLDAVIRPEDLPGGAPGGSSAERAARAELQRLEADLSEIADELDGARNDLGSRAGATTDAARRLDDIRDELRRAEEERERALARASEAAQDAAAAAAEAMAAREALAARRAAIDERHQAALEAARERVERAQQEMLAEESTGAPLRLDPEDVAELEDTHAGVEAAEERAERLHIPNPLTVRRLRAAQRREQQVLDRLGLPTYGAYLIRSSPMHVDPDAARRHLQALAELDDAKEALAELESGPPELAEILAEEAALRASHPEAFAGEAPEASDETAGAHRAALDAEEALADARAQENAAAAQVAALEARLHAIESDLEGVHVALEEFAAEQERPSPDPTPPSPEDVEVFVLARLAGLRGIGCAGASPAVVDDAFADMPHPGLARLLALLDRVSDAVQTIYLTDSPEILAWGESLGHDRCLVVDVP